MLLKLSGAWIGISWDSPTYGGDVMHHPSVHLDCIIMTNDEYH